MSKKEVSALEGDFSHAISLVVITIIIVLVIIFVGLILAGENGGISLSQIIKTFFNKLANLFVPAR